MRSLQLLYIGIWTSTCRANANGTAGGSNDVQSDVLASDLFEWLRDNGAYISEKLVLKHVVLGDPSSPRGVFAVEAMEAGERVCTIPTKLIVKWRDELMDGLPAEMSYCGTIKAVMEETSRVDMTPYGKYLAAQPEGYLPKFWSKSGKEWLIEMLASTRTEQLTAYDELPPRGVYGTVEELQRECYGDVDDPRYLQSAMLVAARSDYDVMVPFYDMINHHNGKYNVKHNIDPYKPKTGKEMKEKGYEMVTTQAIQAGDQLYNSYNRCNVCNEYYDWFGTPEMFLNFGFVESLPQRWLFDFARVKFDLDWKNGDESTREIVVKFLVPPSEKGLDLLRIELDRLEAFAAEYRTEDEEEEEEEDDDVSEYEWESIWQYYDALHDALSYAVQSDVTLSDDVWDMGDDWWVKDGPIKAADVNEHYVLPTRTGGTSTNDEL